MYLHVRSDAAVGRTSKVGLQHILRHDDKTLYVSLGANDPDDPVVFRKRVRLILKGRDCVAWLSIPHRPKLNHVLATEPVKMVSYAGVSRAPDGIHATPAGYRTLAHRMRSAC